MTVGKMFVGKRYWIVGASEGLGRALAEALDKRGARLVISARNEDRLRELAGSLRDSVAIGFDVSDGEAVARAAAAVGDCDGVIYCVGLYDPVPATEWDARAIEAMCDANFIGAVRLLGQVLPGFVARDRGHVVLIGSLAGFRGLPGAIGYGASKAALMHLAQNLRIDLAGTAVRVQVMNPGFIKTRLTDKNDFTMPQIMTPGDAAERVVRAMESGGFRTSFPVPFAWLFTLGQFLPWPIFRRIFT